MTQPPDPHDLTLQIDADQKRLGDLNVEQGAALIAYRDGRYQTLIAETKLKAVRGEIDVLKARVMAKMAMLKAIPR